MATSYKGARPFISYNGLQVPDSHFAIQWLEENGVTKKLDGGLDAKTASLSEAYRMLAVSLCDLMSMWRWLVPANAQFVQQTILADAPALLRRTIYQTGHKKSLKRFQLAGLARHSRAELLSLADCQLDALATLLGDGQGYLLGTDAPTTLDSAVFGILCQFVLAGNARVHAAAVTMTVAKGAAAALGAPLADFEVARAVTPGMVRYVRRVGHTVFPEFGAGVDDETWRGLEADTRATQAARQRLVSS
ncbi:hypothetical protein HK405_009059 [Cladochytrium tenue]|nr:hypothetical protein HK405_009059 [Cladochytrium tenue]